MVRDPVAHGFRQKDRKAERLEYSFCTCIKLPCDFRLAKGHKDLVNLILPLWVCNPRLFICLRVTSPQGLKYHGERSVPLLIYFVGVPPTSPYSYLNMRTATVVSREAIEVHRAMDFRLLGLSAA